MLRSPYARRLLIAVLALAAVDAIEPGILRRLEASRYEDVSRDFRFENSDLFGVGPMTAYLREHPTGRQPRVMFLGNSVTYGYGLSAAEAVPGQYQRLDASAKVLNAGVNGLDAGSQYLIAKATLGTVERVYVLTRTDAIAHPRIANRVPIDAEDAGRFSLPVRTPLEQSLTTVAERWALYRDAYRLQAALFGTSSRQFLYLQKGAAVRGLLSVVRADALPSQPAQQEVTAVTPKAGAMPSTERLADLRRSTPPMLWLFADLFRGSNATIAILHVPGFSEWLPDERSLADFNRACFPYARVVSLGIPPGLLHEDGLHFTAAGAASAARALRAESRMFESAP